MDKKKNLSLFQSIFLFVLGLLLLSVAIYCGYYFFLYTPHKQSKILPKQLSTSSMICTPKTNDWKYCHTQNFSFDVPGDWKLQEKQNAYYFTSSTGENNLLIIVSNSKPDLTGAPDDVQTKDIQISNELAKQYYGCFGIEGCLNEYILSVSHKHYYYELKYLPYNQPPYIYSEIVDTFQFLQ